jgi:hypothetical protein
MECWFSAFPAACVIPPALARLATPAARSKPRREEDFGSFSRLMMTSLKDSAALPEPS